MEKVYNYSNNILDFKRKDGTHYKLDLRGNVTIIDGDSGTGKTVLVDEICTLQDNKEALTGVDTSNITIIKSQDTKISDEEVLYIIDRADKILNSDLCDRICSCKKARFLVFARGSYNLGVSPNHFGILVKDGNIISIHYDFNESWW